MEMVLLQLLVEAVEEDFLPLEGMTRNMVPIGNGTNALTTTSGDGPVPGTNGNGAASTTCGGGGGGFFTSGGNDQEYGSDRKWYERLNHNKWRRSGSGNKWKWCCFNYLWRRWRRIFYLWRE